MADRNVHEMLETMMKWRDDCSKTLMTTVHIIIATVITKSLNLFLWFFNNAENPAYQQYDILSGLTTTSFIHSPTRGV